ncbi:kinase-like protein [Coniophora puteana RWD-64-598 SS2]|uniref:Kinase-like protein n=1 Tax=Coniophora puteana (strain RWD-64-598) TaxID=741705 RepID=A0A5M3MRZ9_CONPW|nr:kinase-like protein [Coniophora puteana RWD-64-598 SS2]EIW81847.1 kinase-like protein [Coniophora puteana RWD-64-598 SS2]
MCREAAIWRYLRHPNVLPFLGAVYNGTEIHVVTPFMENGSVMDYLERNPDVDRVRLILDVAKGLHYLHTFIPTIIHGDIKGANVLITDDGAACIADFGTIGIKDDARTNFNASSTAVGRTFAFAAPELLEGAPGHSRHTPQSDMYAFGGLCYELFSGDPPFAGWSPFSLVNAISNGTLPGRPVAGPGAAQLDDALWDMITRCWRSEPSERPTAKVVIQFLEERYTVAVRRSVPFVGSKVWLVC